MILTFGAVYVFVLAGVFPGRPRVTWLLPMVWFYLACTRIRHAPLFAVVASLALADMLPATRWARWLARPGSDLFVYPAKESAQPRRFQPAPYLLPVGSVLLTLFLIAGSVFLVMFFRFSVIISHLRDDNIALAQRVAILEYHIQNLRSHEE